MGANTKIEWAEHTLNFWMGCEPVSEGCANCYAARHAKRCGRDPAERKRVSDKTIRKVLGAAKAGEFVFVNSLSDFFDPKVPTEWRGIAESVMLSRSDVIFLLLTKRPAEMAAWAQKVAPADRALVSHIWLGVTAENQVRADERIPQLIAIDWPGKQFVSIEPMLGRVDLMKAHPAFFFDNYLRDYSDASGRREWADRPILDWVIVGGESGAGARPMHPEWARGLRDQCQAAGVPFFMKQGSQANWPAFRDFESFPKDLQVRERPDAT